KGIETVRMIGQLLLKGVLLRYTEEPFDVNGTKFDRGSVLVLKTANKSFGENLWSIVEEVANQNNIQLYPVSTGFVEAGHDFGSEKIHSLKAPRVVLLTGEGTSSNAAGEIWHFFDQQLNYPITLINANDFARANWSNIDVVIMPDGNYSFLNNKTQSEDFRNWISKGGRVVALESAVAQLAKSDFGIKMKKSDSDEKKDDKDIYSDLKKFEDRERDYLTGSTPGSILRVELDNTHPLAFGYPSYYYTLKMDDNIYDFFKEDGWNVGIIKKDNQLAGFIGSAKKERLKDGLLFGVEEMGNGTVTYLADNVLFRSFWENGKLMLCNAVFLVGQ
ncbi:MAG: zinc carboxypeptidase, partial [Bacteroidetes bacterium]|nr:zinc carboxypeptidase [Bacteroidota bacterium]